MSVWTLELYDYAQRGRVAMALAVDPMTDHRCVEPGPWVHTEMQLTE